MVTRQQMWEIMRPLQSRICWVETDRFLIPGYEVITFHMYKREPDYVWEIDNEDVPGELIYENGKLVQNEKYY